MALDRILLADFRNHARSSIEGMARFNLLVGENGAGKTNVLEAISLLAPGRGLRRAGLADMAAQGGGGGFALSAELASPAGTVQLGTGMRPERPGRRVVQVNGAEAPANRLGEWLSIGWLTPAMDRLFVDSAGGRRRFLDRLALALHPGHARNASRLETALRERNRMLSDEREPDPAWFDAIETQIAQAGTAVAEARADMLERLAGALAVLPDVPFARPALTYEPGGPTGGEELAATLRANRARDRAAQRTLVGPHRDEIAVVMAGKGQRAAECSTGEQKAMLIAIALAHSQVLEDELAQDGRPRLLLLDEVAAHLDPVRREALFDRLRGGGAQVWLTGTELAPFAAIEDEAAIWRVSEGALRPLRPG
ncbi:DNA replication and repair protein RecF [Novosphingobium marinum]|uniref:DNA replication and repair protein RecF n=1 Tax=Novosphingobium marinum TaxID=1514948 RepID=A0A7Y9XVM7_9SPHN|nr:DNA replication/repair protein RecF [Novosphingobium marinum]NYH95409.1 DNA replication and repair protein RecF [Novosphingobium marinum]GGC26821.1 DNA replication and repair protein RecF [Novosphingobium marinum]